MFYGNIHIVFSPIRHRRYDLNLRHGPRETQVLRDVLPLSRSEKVSRGHVDGQVRVLAGRRGADRDIRRVASDRLLCAAMEGALDSLRRPNTL